MIARFFRLIVLVLLPSVSLVAVVQAASFDCNKATTETEITICADPELSALDKKLSEQWSKMSPLFPMFDQMQWLAWRDKCDNSFCIKNAMKRRLAFLQEINKEIGQSNPLSCLVGSSKFNIYGHENGLRLLVIDGPDTFKKIQMTSKSHGSGICRHFDYLGFNENTQVLIKEYGRCTSSDYPFEEDLAARVMIGSMHFDCLSIYN